MKKKLVSLSVGLVMLFNLSACGTLLYPERKGQVDGRIDIGVALLNAVGLLVWVIPGIIAFAVDFSNGTIYLPSGSTVELTPDELETLKAEGDDVQKVQRLLEAKLAGTALPASQQWEIVPIAHRDTLQQTLVSYRLQ